MPPTYLCSVKFVQEILEIEPVHAHIPGRYTREDKIERILLKFQEKLELSEEQIKKAKIILEEVI